MALHILCKHGILVKYENSVNNVFDDDGRRDKHERSIRKINEML